MKETPDLNTHLREGLKMVSSELEPYRALLPRSSNSVVEKKKGKKDRPFAGGFFLSPDKKTLVEIRYYGNQLYVWNTFRKGQKIEAKHESTPEATTKAVKVLLGV